MPINNRFVRILALESARLGPDPSLDALLDEPISVRSRYAPMTRLLSRDDEIFLVQQGIPSCARLLRSQHRGCYFSYVRELACEIRTARRLRAVAMASQENWGFGSLLAYTVLSESSLLYLRWLGYRHSLGITVAARDVKECLDFLLAAQRFDLVTT